MECRGIKRQQVKQQVQEFKDRQDPFLNFILWKKEEEDQKKIL